MKTKMITLMTGLLVNSLFASTGELTDKFNYTVECDQYTRTYVSHTKIEFNNSNWLSYDFSYSYDIYGLGPATTSGQISSHGYDDYPTVSKVKVQEEGNLLTVEAVSQIVGGRNPHMKSVNFELEKISEGFYSANKLIINGTDYSNFVGTCDVIKVDQE